MSKPLETMLAHRRWAVLGATEDRSRYGWKIWRMLRDFGYHAAPINPRLDEIDGEPCHASITAVEPAPHVACFVVNPGIGLKLLEEAHGAGVRHAWLQPGARSEDLRQRAQALGIEVVEDCVLIQLGRRDPPAW
jgi:predicted CoA-binding protein